MSQEHSPGQSKKNDQQVDPAKEALQSGITYEAIVLGEDAGTTIYTHIDKMGRMLDEVAYSSIFKDLSDDLDAMIRFADRINNVRSLLNFTDSRRADVARQIRDGKKELQEAVLFVAKNEQADPVGIILFELYKGDTFETIQDPVIGQFTKKEYQDLYPPGTQLRCRRRANSLCVLPHYQGKGIGRELIKRSTARMKENKVIMYADLLSPDSAKLLKWMVDEALIEDFCRVGLPHKDADAGAGRYVFILKNETEA